MTYHRETQSFRQPWLLALLAAPAVAAWWAWFAERSTGEAATPFAAPVLITIFLVWFLSIQLITEVRDGEIYLKFRLLWPAKIVTSFNPRRSRLPKSTS